MAEAEGMADFINELHLKVKGRQCPCPDEISVGSFKKVNVSPLNPLMVLV